LTDDPVYQVLQEEFRSDGQKLAQSVAKAYLNEKSSSARSKLVEAEAKLQEKLNKTREKVLAADKNAAAHLRENSDLYVEFGFDDLAAQELDRAMNHPAQDNFAECYTIAGRIRAMRGDYAGGIAEADRGVAMGGTNYMNYLNRADIYRAAGDFNRAVEDAERARAIKEDELSLSLCATIYDEAGRADEAKELYAKLYDRRRDSYIPLNYLEEIDPEEAKKRREYKK